MAGHPVRAPMTIALKQKPKNYYETNVPKTDSFVSI